MMKIEIRDKQIVMVNDNLYLTGIIYNYDLITLLKLEGLNEDLECLIKDKIENNEFVHVSIIDKFFQLK